MEKHKVKTVPVESSAKCPEGIAVCGESLAFCVEDVCLEGMAVGTGTKDATGIDESTCHAQGCTGRAITLIVPCYNEEESLPFFYAAVLEVLVGMGCGYELLFVDDGSKDQTLAVLKGLAEQDSCVKYLSFSRNFGKEAAMYAGFCNAHGDYVAVLDADMQDPPSLLPKMFGILEGGEYDSVAARRADRAGEPPIRSWFARKFYQIINKISDADIVDGARDFRMMKREMVEAIVSMCEYNRFSKGIYGWVGFRTYWLPYENVERVAGETKWNFWKLFKYAVDGIINFSQAPLSIASLFGVFMTFFSFLLLMVIIVRKIAFGDPVD